MNEKQLGMIDEWLQGQHRYKLLDCEQEGFLQLKGTLLQVWMACFIHENDDQQSWLSNGALGRLTGLSENTVRHDRKWLVENGWIKPTGHVAAIKYANPSQGAYSVPVVRVDNPCKNCIPAKAAPRFSKRGANFAPAKVAPPPANFAPKGSVSVSAAGSLSDSKESNSNPVSLTEESDSTLSASPCNGDERDVPSLLPSGDENQKTKAKTRASVVKWLQKYDAPKPVDFDTWSVSARAMWIEAHRLRPGQVPSLAVPLENELDSAPRMESSAPADPTPQHAAPPTQKFNCPACEFGSKYGYNVAEHIEKEHPQLGQQSFEITCPEAGCDWHTWWNKVDNNKAVKDAALLEHLEFQHNPNSSRYDPWEMCKCGVDVRRSEKENHRCKGAA